MSASVKHHHAPNIDIVIPEDPISHSDHQGRRRQSTLAPIDETEEASSQSSTTTSSLKHELINRIQTPPRPLVGHKERCFDLAFHPKNTLLASASEDGMVYLWDLEEGKIMHQLSHESEVLRVSWSRTTDGDGYNNDNQAYLVSATASGTVRVWDVQTSSSLLSSSSIQSVEPLCELMHREGSQVYACKFVDKTTLLTAADDAVLLWDIDSQQCLSNWHFDHLPGGASGGFGGYGGPARNPDSTCYVFDVCVGRLGPSHTNDSVCVALSDGSVRIQDRRSARAVATLQRTGIHLTSLLLGSDAGVLVACGGKGESTVYDVRTWSVSAVLHGHKGPVYGAEFVPPKLMTGTNGPESWVMTWSSDKTLQFYHITSASGNVLPTETVEHPNFPIYCAGFSPFSDRLVLAGGTGEVCCDAAEGEENHHHGHHHHGHKKKLPTTLLCYDL